MSSDKIVSCGHRAGKATARAQARIEILEAERDGAREAYDRMKVERDAALDALHRVRRALGLGGVLGRPETIAESAERRGEQALAALDAASWEALCTRAAGWVSGDAPSIDLCTPQEWEEYCVFRNRRSITFHDEIAVELASLALFARLMAIVSRPS